ncbi:MAG: ATP-binding protein, partial [Bacteroidota bacterium]
QEFIQNTIKYAEANEIQINLTKKNDSFELAISDNGKGFDLVAINYGNGILNMKRRCEDLRGEFLVESSSKGTKISCLIPF